MAAALLIVRKKGAKRRPKRFFVNRKDGIETSSPDVANQALHMGGGAKGIGLPLSFDAEPKMRPSGVCPRQTKNDFL
jgi:hypothetical protein